MDDERACKHNIIFTDRVRSTTERLCFDMCLFIHQSVCPHLWGEGGTQARSRGGTQARSSRGGGGYPDRGSTPTGGYPRWSAPHQIWMGGTPTGYPDGGYPRWGTPHQTWMGGTLTGGIRGGVPPIRPGQGGTPTGARSTPLRLTDGELDKRRSVCLLPSRRRTFLLMMELITKFEH